MNTLTSSPDTQELQAKIDLLSEALDFYARYIHERKSDGECMILTPIEHDCGNRARTTLDLVGLGSHKTPDTPPYGMSTLSFCAINKFSQKIDAVFSSAAYQKVKDYLPSEEYSIVETTKL